MNINDARIHYMNMIYITTEYIYPIIFILSDINQHNAEAVAKRCHQAVQKAKYYIGRKRYSLSVSLGVANSSTEFTSQQVLQQSDEALFSAKNKGGNQVHVAS